MVQNLYIAFGIGLPMDVHKGFQPNAQLKGKIGVETFQPGTN